MPKAHTREFVAKRRKAVLVLMRKGKGETEITAELAKKFDNPTPRTISSDLAFLRREIVNAAQKLVGEVEVAVADFIHKTLELREMAVKKGKLDFAHELDKTLLRFVGVNLNKVDVDISMTGGRPQQGQFTTATFTEVMNEVRATKQLPPVTEDEI